jgi:hypothetical protein
MPVVRCCNYQDDCPECSCIYCEEDNCENCKKKLPLGGCPEDEIDMER